MSDIVSAQCSNLQLGRVQERLSELQSSSPSSTVSQYEAMDDLIHHGYMLLRLPAEEIAPIIARANEIMGES